MSILIKNLKNKISKKKLITKHLVAVKNHIGNKVEFRNSNMDEYIIGVNSTQNTIFNPNLILTSLRRVLNFLKQLKKKSGSVLIVSTKPEFSNIIKHIGESSSQPYVNTSWQKGLLTNWEHLCVSIKFYRLFLERLKLKKKKKRKIYNNFHGLRTMKELPSAVFVIDPKTDIEVIRESKRLNIPVISIVDSDYSYELIDYPIPGNNNSILSIYFLLSIVLQALK